MNEKAFKVLGGFFLLLVLLSICNKRDRQPSSRPAASSDQYNVNVQTVVSASEGLNLAAVGDLLKDAKDAETFERLLNSADNGVNNLDLDEDGVVDYIHVTEYGDDRVKGFSLTTQPGPGETQEVATIEVEKVGSDAQVQIQGNEQIYGQNHYHHSRFGLTDMLILGWMFSPHRMYGSPWGYGSYPQYYSRPATRSQSDYQRSSRSGSSYTSSNSSRMSSSAKSPNAGKSATSVKAPLKNPTSAQKQFQARNPSKQAGSGGFGRSTNQSTPSRSTTTRSSTVRRSAPSRSRSFSSGGK